MVTRRIRNNKLEVYEKKKIFQQARRGKLRDLMI
jgi:hypothetical protein